MRTKRVQRRRRAVPAPKGTPGYMLPDPFSRLNEDLVRYEVDLEGMCPCCLDRQAEIDLRREERLYLRDADEYQRSTVDGLENRYTDQWPACGERFCFCTDCVEASEHDGPDYDEWRRAFPALPWG